MARKFKKIPGLSAGNLVGFQSAHRKPEYPGGTKQVLRPADAPVSFAGTAGLLCAEMCSEK